MQKNKVFHILSYIPLLFIISLFIPEKDDPTVKFHCGQGIVLTVFCVLCSVVNTVLGFIIGWIPFIGVIICGLVSLALSIITLALMIFGIYNAAKDKEEQLPIIGKYTPFTI